MQETEQFAVGELLVQQGSILFPEYETVREQAINLSETMLQVEVTSENIKRSKQLLAAVNKEVNKLNDERIKAKKKLLEPYDELEKKVKEINSIVKNAENTMRQQVRELEEKERDEKEQVIRTIFEKRMKQYDFEELMGFDKFLSPQHLNKSYSMTKVESEMVKWFTKVEEDLSLIYSMEYSYEIIAEYQRTQNVTQSIQTVNDRHKVIQEMERKSEPLKVQTKTSKPTTKVVFELYDNKDARLVEMFMQQEQIEYVKNEFK